MKPASTMALCSASMLGCVFVPCMAGSLLWWCWDSCPCSYLCCVLSRYRWIRFYVVSERHSIAGPGKEARDFVFSGKLTVAFRSRCIVHHLFSRPSIPRGVGPVLVRPLEGNYTDCPRDLADINAVKPVHLVLSHSLG